MNKSEREATIYMLKGMMCDLTPEQRETIEKLKSAIIDLVKSDSEHGMIALALANLEVTP